MRYSRYSLKKRKAKAQSKSLRSIYCTPCWRPSLASQSGNIKLLSHFRNETAGYQSASSIFFFFFLGSFSDAINRDAQRIRNDFRVNKETRRRSSNSEFLLFPAIILRFSAQSETVTRASTTLLRFIIIIRRAVKRAAEEA